MCNNKKLNERQKEIKVQEQANWTRIRKRKREKKSNKKEETLRKKEMVD